MKKKKKSREKFALMLTITIVHIVIIVWPIIYIFDISLIILEKNQISFFFFLQWSNLALFSYFRFEKDYGGGGKGELKGGGTV